MTVRRWIQKDAIDVTVIETDKKRIYLAYNDLLALAEKHRPQVGNLTERVKSAQALAGLYTLAEVASLLGIHVETIKDWLRHSDIQKRLITTDRKRVYISYSDILKLAEMHNRTITYDALTALRGTDAQADSPSPADNNVQANSPSQTDNNVRADSPFLADNHSQDEQFYTLLDAALFLGVTEVTLRDWLSAYHIEKNLVVDEKRGVCISSSDVLTLASKIKQKSGSQVNLIADIAEMKSRLLKIEAIVLNMENHIKRSIYIGKK